MKSLFNRRINELNNTHCRSIKALQENLCEYLKDKDIETLWIWSVDDLFGQATDMIFLISQGEEKGSLLPNPSNGRGRQNERIMIDIIY